MSELPRTHEGSLLWTLEEISRLVSHSGNSGETLTNIVQADPAAVRDRRLLGLSAGARSLQPGAGRDHRPAAGKRRARPHAADRRAGRAGRRSSVRPQVVADATKHPRFKYFPRGRRGSVSLVSRRAADRSRAAPGRAGRPDRASPATFSPDDVRMLVTAGTQLAPIVSEARTLGQFVAPAHQRLRALAQNLWWSWDDETSGLFRSSTRCCGARWTTTPSPCCSRSRSRSSRSAPRSSPCTAASTTPTAGCRSTCTSSRTWGARHAGVLWARPVAYFSAEFGLHESMPIYSGGLGILAGDHLKSASDLASRWSASGSTTTRATSGSGSTATAGSRRTTSTSTAACCRCGRPRAPGRAGRGHDRDPHRHDCRARLAGRGRPQHAAAARLERRGQPARGPRADRPPVRRRPSRPHPPGAAARRRRRARARRAGHLAGRRAPERGPQRVRRRWSWCASGWPPRASTPTRPCAASRRRSSSRRTRRCPPATTASRRRWSRSTSARCARRSGSATISSWASGRVDPHDSGEEFCMTVLALKLSPPRQRRLVAARPGLARHVEPALPGAREEQVPIGHITNGVHVQTWLAPQMRQVYDRHFGPDWPQRCRRAGLLGSDRRRRRRRAVGDAPDAQDAADRLGAPAGGAGTPSGEASRRRSSASSGAP